MILKKWEDIPEILKNDQVYAYYEMLSKKKISLVIKRIFDIILALIILVILFIPMVIVAIAIKLDSKGPVFYRQERVTKYNKTFKIYKFRTMVNNADKIGNLITEKNDTRITKVGKLIRKLRIDEVPQLINILIGDMSLVGTRPEVRKYVDQYTDEMKATLLMPAGVTSTASIEYKNEDEVMSICLDKGEVIDDIYINKILPNKMKYNLEYIKQFNILQDIRICLKTVIAVFIKKEKNNIINNEDKNKDKIKI